MQTAGKPNRQAGVVKAELPGAWGCERLGEAFAEDAVGWVGGLLGRGRGIESLDSDGKNAIYLIATYARIYWA